MAFLESKIKRGPGGQFARKIGSLSSTSKQKRAAIRKKQKGRLQGNGLTPKERFAAARKKGSATLGKRVVTKLEKASNKRASKRRKGKRTRR